MLIGIDLGGTNIGIGVMNEGIELIYKGSIPTNRNRSYKEIIGDMAKLVEDTIVKASIDREEIKGIGVGVPGIVDPRTGILIELVNLGWKDVDLVKDLEAILNIPVFVGNDATVAGVAEYEIGAMKGYKSGILYTLGTGIGAGIILNGNVYDGAHGLGAEVGHMIVGENYYHCNCGRNGCLETFSSSTAIINYTCKLIDEGQETMILNMVNGDKNKIDGKIIFDAAKAGDELALKVVDRMTTYLAKGIVNTMSIIDPEVFVLGGGLCAAGDFLLHKVKEKVEEYKYYRGVEPGEIKLSIIGNDGGIIGAAQLCKHRLI